MLARRTQASRTALILASVALLLTGCAQPVSSSGGGPLQVVTTTGILADLASHVAGDKAIVRSLVPDGADPHSFEPSLRTVRDISYADVAFTNYLLLEEQSLIKSLDANLRPDVPNVRLAERAAKYSAELISLVENANLDAVWLGLRVNGRGEQFGATRTSEVKLKATAMDGPGHMLGYLTEAFGNASVYFDSTDGFDASAGNTQDTTSLPPDAHTHMSWAFTEPGVYTLTLRAELAVEDSSQPVLLGETNVTFAVGVNPRTVAGMADATVLDGGHADLAVDLDAPALGATVSETKAEFPLAEPLYIAADTEQGGTERLSTRKTVIEVPAKALTPLPPDTQFRSLGRPGTLIYQLPQAVLGKHVHGEIDPHLWLNVRNAQAYVKIIRDTLSEADPANTSTYVDNAAAYIADLEELDREVATTVAAIPEERRSLITTHDAFGYFGKAYGLNIAGFVTPNPAVEPSLADRQRLGATLKNLQVPAVFLEPQLASRSSTLTELAEKAGVAVCPIYSDSFDARVRSYEQLMRFNAQSVAKCLAPAGPGRNK